MYRIYLTPAVKIRPPPLQQHDSWPFPPAPSDSTCKGQRPGNDSMASSLLGEKTQLLGIWLAIWQLWKLRKNHKEPQEVELLKRNFQSSAMQYYLKPKLRWLYALQVKSKVSKAEFAHRACTSSIFIDLHRFSSLRLPLWNIGRSQVGLAEPGGIWR